MARIFTECDPQNEVLFLDEADTLLQPRDAGGHRADVAVTAEFLRRIEAFSGVFVCATNFRSALDSALMRRFTFRLAFEPLSIAQRQLLLCETALGWNPAGQDPLPPLEPEVLSRLMRLDQLTPGDFANVVKRARSLQLALDIHGWVDELTAEHDTKPQGARTAIGFL